MERVRAYHVTLATLTILAFLTGDFGFVHDLPGYGVAAIIVFRLLWALFNQRQLGLNRFYPQSSKGCAPTTGPVIPASARR